jgi:hypothetical protein
MFRSGSRLQAGGGALLLEEDDEVDCIASEWCNWVRQEEFHVVDYSRRDLVFAKFDPTGLVESTDNRFAVNGSWRGVAQLVRRERGLLRNPC